MSTAQAAGAKNDYKHPEWCDLTRCSPDAGGEVASGTHESAGTLWPIQSGEADFTVRLVRYDDFDQGRSTGIARLQIMLRQHAWGVGPDGQLDMWAEAGVNVEDARALAALLTKYADFAERDNRFRMDFAASDCSDRSIR